MGQECKTSPENSFVKEMEIFCVISLIKIHGEHFVEMSITEMSAYHNNNESSNLELIVTVYRKVLCKFKETQNVAYH